MITLREAPISREQPVSTLTMEKAGSTVSCSVYEHGSGESTIFLTRDQLFELLSTIEEYLLDTSDG